VEGGLEPRALAGEVGQNLVALVAADAGGARQRVGGLDDEAVQGGRPFDGIGLQELDVGGRGVPPRLR